MQHQPPNIVDRAPASVVGLNELHGKMKELQRKIHNNEMLGTAEAGLEVELRQLKLEGQNLHERLQ